MPKSSQLISVSDQFFMKGDISFFLTLSLWTAIKGCLSVFDTFQRRALSSQPTSYQVLYIHVLFMLCLIQFFWYSDTFHHCQVNVTPELSNTPSITKAYPPNFSDFERDHGEKRVPESRSIFANVKININCHCTMTQSDSKEEVSLLDIELILGHFGAAVQIIGAN